jgi:uncharacterized protein DUF3455
MHDQVRGASRISIITVTSVVLGSCTGVPGAAEDVTASTAAAISTEVCPAGVPVALVPGIDQTLKSTFTGIGVQIYICNNGSAGPTWTFVAPQANLINDDGKLIGTHFIGPTWQGNDGSAVVGARVAGATVDATAIPWLLLTATSHNGIAGRFSDVTSIQRLSTVGGLAPATGCDVEHLGTIVQAPYSAQYVFYRTKDQGKIKQCGGD